VSWITKKELLSKRGDLSQFLIHLTRTGILKVDKDLYSLENDDTLKINAKTCLEEIIKSKRIEARSAFGFFNYSVPLKRMDGTIKNQNSLVKRDWLRATCFTETPIEHIALQTYKIYGRKLHFENYGLAFKEEVVRSRNGNPIFYADTGNTSIRRGLESIVTTPLAIQFKSFMPLVEGFGAPWFPSFFSPTEIDFRWEREWRVCGDFSFSISDIAFGICPAGEIVDFEKLLGNQVPFVDPISNLATAKQKLKAQPHLRDLK
jgi:hypothetical protein